MISQESKKGWLNPWLLGMIGVILTALAVNALLIWYSMHHRSTLVDHEYNTRSRKSDTATMQEIESRNALGWKVSIKRPQGLTLGVPASYEMTVQDRQGAPVSGSMEVLAYRAADASKDFVTPFKETTTGNYQGAIAFPLKGYWELRIRVMRGKEVFETETSRFAVADNK